MLEHLFFIVVPVYTAFSLLFPEINFTLFLFIGRINYEPRLGFFNIYSLNQINFFIMFIHLVWTVRFYRLKKTIKFYDPNIFVLFLVWLCYNFLFLSENMEYGFDKIIVSTFVTFFSIIYFSVRYQYIGIQVIKKIFFWLCLVGIGMTCVGVTSLLIGNIQGRLAILGGGPNVFGRVVGMSIIIMLIYFQIHKKSVPKYLLVCIITLLIIAMIGTLSKGPILSLILTWIFLFIFPVPERKVLKNILLFITGCLILIIFIFLLGKAERYFLNPFAPISYGSYGTRIESYRVTFDAIKEHPLFGVGLGNFIFYNHVYDYPHNIFLEIFAELGLIGITIFLIMLSQFIYSLSDFIKRIKCISPDDILTIKTISALTFFMFLNQLVSGDLMDSRYFLVFMFLTFALLNNITPQNSKTKTNVETV